MIAKEEARTEEYEPRTLEDVETEHILRTLDRRGGNKAAAAADLGVSLKTIYNKLARIANAKA